jgi:hypothetical protein
LLPSLKITACPSLTPTTLVPSPIPSRLPAATPSTLPTFAPSIHSTPKPTTDPTPYYVDIYVSTGGTYKGTSGRDNFYITSPANTILSGAGGADKFTFYEYPHVITTITDFNVTNNLIDLTAFTSIVSMTDLTITQEGLSTSINLGNDQKIVLSFLNRKLLKNSNFNLYDDSTDNSGGSSTDLIAIIFSVIPSFSTIMLVVFSKSICIAAFDAWTPRVPATIPGQHSKNIVLYPCKLAYRSFYIRFVEERDILNLEREKSKITQNSNDMSDPKQTSPTSMDSQASTVEVSEVELTESFSSEVDERQSSRIRNPMLYDCRPSVYMITEINYANPMLKFLTKSTIGVETIRLYGKDTFNLLIQMGADNEWSTNILIEEMKRSGVRSKSLASLFHEQSTRTEMIVMPPMVETIFTPTRRMLIDQIIIIRNFVEYLPALNHITTNILCPVIYPTLQYFIPEIMSNISISSIRFSKRLLLTSHVTLGAFGAMLLPKNLQISAMGYAAVRSLSYGSRLTSQYFLESSFRDEDLINRFGLVGYCGTSIIAYTVPEALTCAIASVSFPGYSCSELSLFDKITLPVVDCYEKYRKLYVEDIVTSHPSQFHYTSTVVVPLILDVIAASISIYHHQTLFNTLNVVVHTDFITKVGLDMISSTMKRNNIGATVIWLSAWIKKCFEGDCK